MSIDPSLELNQWIISEKTEFEVVSKCVQKRFFKIDKYFKKRVS